MLESESTGAQAIRLLIHRLLGHRTCMNRRRQIGMKHRTNLRTTQRFMCALKKQMSSKIRSTLQRALTLQVEALQLILARSDPLLFRLNGVLLANLLGSTGVSYVGYCRKPLYMAIIWHTYGTPARNVAHLCLFD